MKKCISMILLLAMMLSLAVVGTVGTSAYSDFDEDKYYGCYVTGETAPTIDGVIDEIWSTTVPMYFGNTAWGYVKLLCSEDAVYLLADMISPSASCVNFYVTTKAYNKNWAWSWTEVDGCHYFQCQKDTDSSSDGYQVVTLDYLAEGTRANDATAKAIQKADGNGFVAEVRIPLGANDATMGIDSTIGFGAMVNNDWYTNQCVGFHDPSGDTMLKELVHDRNVGIIYAMKLHSPVYTQTKAPTCTETGTESAICSGSGCKVAMALPERTVPAWGHEFEETATVDAEPTLITKGSQSHHCSRCTETKDTSAIDETTIQYVGAQTSDVTNGTYNVRFVAQIADKLNDFKAAGFKVSIVSATGLKNAEGEDVATFVDQTLTSSVAYTSIDAEKETVEADSEVGGKYLIAIPITGIPADASITFKITPVTVSTDGTVVEATGTNSYTVVLNNGEVVK